MFESFKKRTRTGQLALAMLFASALNATCLDRNWNTGLWQKFAPLLREDLRPGISTRTAFEKLFKAPGPSRRSTSDEDVYKYEWATITVYITDTRGADGTFISTTLRVERNTFDPNTCVTDEDMSSGLSSAGWEPGRPKKPSADSQIIYPQGEVLTPIPSEQYFRKNESFNAFDLAEKNGLVCAAVFNLIVGKPE